jgi:antitoxin component YwqK of YwqJK toxin-antitoxin module
VNFFTDLEERDGLYYKKLTDDPFTGKVTGYNLTGSLKDGKQEGTWVYYHDNGQLWEKGNYKNGKKHGAWVWYWKNGQLKYKDNYKNGKKHGAQVLYHKNGQLFRKGNYKSGEREGAWVSYNNDGTVITSLTGTFKDGVKISD